MNVAVIGCGPAGLLAAHAVDQINEPTDVTIFAPYEPSVIGGAQYLHEPIPLLTDWKPDGEITYVKIGQAEGYAQKVYGDREAPTSWDAFEMGVRQAWSMVKAYDRLWAKWCPVIQDKLIEPWQVEELCEGYDLVLSSAPAHRLCEVPLKHDFSSQKVQLVPSSPIGFPNAVVYSGRKLDAWYRTSNIFGHEWTEYSCASEQAPIEFRRETLTGLKPLSTTCDCHESHANYQRIGRFGKFQKGVLVHDAYNDALAAIERTVRESVV